jgi:Ni,Fe-hydrogenase III small subunit
MRLLSIFQRHGRQYIRNLRKAEPAGFRGRPVIRNDITPMEAEMVAALCPVGAIQASPFSLDLGKCEFCRECEFALPGKITFTNDPVMASNVRDNLVIKPGMNEPVQVDTGVIRKEIRSLFHYALKLRQVSAGGDNSAEMELNACGNVNFDLGRYGFEFVASPRHADGMVITGPITQNMAEALRICYEAIPEPKLVILAGTAAISGGVFCDSPALDRSILDNISVDLFVPGNPPHPLTFINGVLDLTGRKG